MSDYATVLLSQLMNDIATDYQQARTRQDQIRLSQYYYTVKAVLDETGPTG